MGVGGSAVESEVVVPLDTGRVGRGAGVPFIPGRMNGVGVGRGVKGAGCGW